MLGCLDDGHPHHPRRAVDFRRPEQRHGAVDRRFGRDGRIDRALFIGGHDRAARQDPHPPPRRVRDEHLHPVRASQVHVGPDRPRAVDGRGGGRLRLHPGRRDPRRRERIGDRAARRRPDAELSGLRRPLPRRGMSGSPPEALESLDDLLRRHGLAGIREEPFPNDGWSGASLSLLRRGGGDRFVLKRDSLARDWIARATNDGPVLREAWFAANGPPLPSPIHAPYLGAGVNGDEFGILMPDLTSVLFDWDAPISTAQLDQVLAANSALHAYPWPNDGLRPILGDHDFPRVGPWCPIRERIALISRASLERPGPARDAVADRILPGWDAFNRVASRS